MHRDIVYISAPFDFNGLDRSVIAWDTLPLFQPLLGQDAQMAGFAAVAHAEGLKVSLLVAPEIFSNELAFSDLQKSEENIIAHVRFGSPRFPRLLRRSMNAVVLAEDTTISANLGRHTSRTRAALPASVQTVLVYDENIPVPDRISTGPATCVLLSPEFVKPSEHISDVNLLSAILLQTCSEFSGSAWHRSAAPTWNSAVVETLPRQAAVLLPWNLAAPNSVVPNVLKKISLLATQNRFPLTVVVLPYNDIPGGLNAVEEVAAACGKLCAKHPHNPQILLARTWSISASITLLQLCRRAWIDLTDPEWCWTTQRIGSYGLPVNFISSIPEKKPSSDEVSSFAPEDLMPQQLEDQLGEWNWHIRVVSSRQISALAEAILDEQDRPFMPTNITPGIQSIQPSLRELLRN